MAVYNMNLVHYGNSGIAITPTDDAPIKDTDGNIIQPLLWVGGAGNVAVKTATGQSITFTAVPAGTLIPIMVSEVEATGTTATLIVGIYSM